MNKANQRFIAALALVAISSAYIFGVTFAPIPKANQRNADTGIIAFVGLNALVAGWFFRTMTSENNDKNGTN